MDSLTNLERAAQLWCLPQHASKELDDDLAYSIATALDAAEERGLKQAVACYETKSYWSEPGSVELCGGCHKKWPDNCVTFAHVKEDRP